MSALNVFKVFIGNLPSNLTEGEIRNLLRETQVDDGSILEIMLRRQHAIVSFNEQPVADAVIDNLHSKRMMGRVLKVEPAIDDYRSLPKVLVYNCTPGTIIDDVKQMVNGFCSGWKYSVHKARENTFIIVVERSEQVQKLVERFDDMPLKGIPIKFEPIKTLFGEDADVRRSRGGSGYFQSRLHHSEFPLKMIIPNELVGTIMGRKGEVVKGITQTTGARVDILQNQTMGLKFEKVILIEGSPESASLACRQIMEIIAKEATPSTRQQGYDFCLKLLAPNNLVGRVIGKGGVIIKGMMEESQTKIQVSNTGFEPFSSNDRILTNDRIITIRGSIDGMCTAEWLVSSKIRNAIHEMGGMNTQSSFMNNPMSNPLSMRMGMGVMNNPLGMAPLGLGQSTGMQMLGQQPPMFGPSETSFMFIPHRCVGAIIGSKGINVRRIIQTSGASVKIANAPGSAEESRRVTLSGHFDSILRAQYMITELLMNFQGQGESTGNGNEIVYPRDYNMNPQETKVTIEGVVPTRDLGRLIGKNGETIWEIRRLTKSSVRFITEEENPQALAGFDGRTLVRYTGPLRSVQQAQVRVKEVLMDRTWMDRSSSSLNNSRSSQNAQNYNYNDKEAFPQLGDGSRYGSAGGGGGGSGGGGGGYDKNGGGLKQFGNNNSYPSGSGGNSGPTCGDSGEGSRSSSSTTLNLNGHGSGGSGGSSPRGGSGNEYEQQLQQGGEQQDVNEQLKQKITVTQI